MTNNKMFNVFMFAAGAAVGSAVTWKFIKTKYERIAQEEIDSVKEVFSRRAMHTTSNDNCAQRDWSKLEDCDPSELEAGDDDEYEPSAEEARNYSELAGLYKNNEVLSENEQKGGEEHMVLRPYVISPDNFGEEDGYETVSFTYYADGILEDDYYNVVENVDELIGEDSLNHFGEYEEDSVFVRNEVTKTDYEILRDPRCYSDPVTRPHPRAVEADD